MKPLELTRSGILGTLAVFVVAALCIRLGFWQLDRRDQRLERNAVMAERLAAAPVELERAPRDTTGLTHRRVRIRGTLDDERSIVLAGRSHRGTPGAHLLVPLRTGDGSVLVNRGWLPAPDAVTVDLEPVALDGEVRVEGVLLPFPDVDMDRSSGRGFQRTWYRFDGEALRAQLPYPASELYLQATAGPESTSGPEATSGPVAESAGQMPVVLGAPSLGPGPHLSYAVQWFSFAAVFLLGWLAMLLRPERGGAGGGLAGSS